MRARRELAGAVVLLGVLVLGTSCAKRPDAEVTAAKTAVEQARSAGAAEYLAAPFKNVETGLQKAEEEVTAQDGRFALVRNYDAAKASLAKVKADAEKVRTDAVAAKEKAKAEAEAARTDAQAALDGAKALLAKAPKGKGTKADIEAMGADLKAAEAALVDARTALDRQDYLGAKAKAESARDKAAAVSAQVQQAKAKTATVKKR
jgi:hypothetical protein